MHAVSATRHGMVLGGSIDELVLAASEHYDFRPRSRQRAFFLLAVSESSDHGRMRDI